MMLNQLNPASASNTIIQIMMIVKESKSVNLAIKDNKDNRLNKMTTMSCDQDFRKRSYTCKITRNAKNNSFKK